MMWLTQCIQEVAKPAKEKYPPKTQTDCGKHHFIEEKDENLNFNPLDASDKTSDILISPFHLLTVLLYPF